jgi:hypothetical protein
VALASLHRLQNEAADLRRELGVRAHQGRSSAPTFEPGDARLELRQARRRRFSCGQRLPAFLDATQANRLRNAPLASARGGRRNDPAPPLHKPGHQSTRAPKAL